MHLDADDMLMPHALQDVAGLSLVADVVAMGYERCGDLAAGPRQRVKLYRDSAGPTTLSNPTPASGVSPWRLRFWLQGVRYPLDQVGGHDTALWLQLAHLGARVKATRRPCFRYRQHADSLFNTRRLSDFQGRRTGYQLEGWRRGCRGVSVVVPRAPDGGPRDAAWRWVQARYRALFSDWEMVAAEGPAGETWCKGAVVARGLERARGRVLVVADADCVVAPEALREAVDLVERGAPWVVPHRMVYRLNEVETARWLARSPDSLSAPSSRPSDCARPPYLGYAGGGLVVVNRALYEVCGGIPRDFLGWGAEDEALAVILDTMLGPHHRLDYPLIHLWHPSARRGSLRAAYRANRTLLGHYLRARGNLPMMWALVQRGPRAHLGGADFSHGTRYGPLTRTRRVALEEARMQDTFAQRRLAAARARQVAATAAADGHRPPTPNPERTMAGARDVALAHRRTRLEQQARNAEANAAAEAARAAARAGAAGPRPREARGRKMQPAHDNKMLAGEKVGENKVAMGNASGVILNPGVMTRGTTAVSGHFYAGVRFQTSEAAARAMAEGMKAADFHGRTPKGEYGFTLAQVRAFVQHRGPRAPAT
jgi:hypothetical protein